MNYPRSFIDSFYTSPHPPHRTPCEMATHLTEARKRLRPFSGSWPHYVISCSRAHGV